MTLKRRFLFLTSVAAGGMLLLAGFWLTRERQLLLKNHEDQARTLVETALSTVATQYNRAQSGAISEAQAQTNAREALRVLRYDKTNYLWINDTRPYMIMHPIKPELEGKDLSNSKDPDGKHIFVEFARIAADNPNGGTLYYKWPRPGAEKPVRKLSFVQEFQPWGWVIGTGVYIDDVNAAWNKSAMLAGGTTLLCLLLLLGVSRAIYSSIFTRLQHLTERIRDVAEGEGDLTKRIAIDSEDEIAAVAQWFNTFMDHLHDIIANVASNTSRVSTAAEDLTSDANRSAEGARQQNGQLNQVAAAMQEMSATVAEVSRHSGQAATDARRAVDIARQGGNIVNSALERMHSIVGSVNAAAKNIEELGGRSDQIGQIIAVIEEIAGQTNLLALNAAIEAARAGEHGKGFAVVAVEVRRLAERTTGATKEIAGTIQAVQQETSSAVTRMEEGTRLVELGVTETAKAGSALEEIIAAAQHVGTMVEQIATAANQQTSAVEEINVNVAHIAQFARESEDAVDRSAATCGDLSHLAVDLNQTVGRFKLDKNRAA